MKQKMSPGFSGLGMKVYPESTEPGLYHLWPDAGIGRVIEAVQMSRRVIIIKNGVIAIP